MARLAVALPGPKGLSLGVAKLYVLLTVFAILVVPLAPALWLYYRFVGRRFRFGLVVAVEGMAFETPSDEVYPRVAFYALVVRPFVLPFEVLARVL